MLFTCYFQKLCLPENDPVNHSLQENLHDSLRYKASFVQILFTGFLEPHLLEIKFMCNLHVLQIILPEMNVNDYS